MKLFLLVFGLMLSITSFAQNIKEIRLRCVHDLDRQFDRHALYVQFNSWQNRAQFYIEDSKFTNATEAYLGNDLRSLQLRFKGEEVMGNMYPNAVLDVLLTSPTEITKRGSKITARIRHRLTDVFSWTHSEQYMSCHHI